MVGFNGQRSLTGSDTPTHGTQDPLSIPAEQRLGPNFQPQAQTPTLWGNRQGMRLPDWEGESTGALDRKGSFFT